MSAGGESSSRYIFRVWRTGRTWACHAKSPTEWFREYGFVSEDSARWWGEDVVKEFLRNDALLDVPSV